MKDIITEELNRIKELMGIKKTVVFEQGPIMMMGPATTDYDYSGPKDEYGNAVSSTDPEDLRYGTFTLGQPALKPDIPGFNQPLTLIMGPKEGGFPKIWKLTSGTKVETLIPDYKVLRGDVVDKGGTSHPDQPYILGDDNTTKFCLPTNEWIEKYASLGLVYMFENPKTKKRYSLLLGTWKDSRAFGPKQAVMSGLEASQSCYGGDNGFEFKVTNAKSSTGPRAPYKEVNGGPYWNPNNISMMDPRSDNDIWWDKYSIAIEVVVGIGIAIAAVYIAPALLAIAPELGVVGVLIEGLAGTTYGATNMLVIMIEIVGEFLLLTPLLKNQLSRGDDVSAGLTAVFCLLPFLTEIKGVSNWMKNGISGKFVPADVDNLTAAVTDVGGWKNVLENWSDSQRKLWVETLSPKNQETMSACMQMVKNVGEQGADSGVSYGKFVADIIDANAVTIQKNINQMGYSETDKAVSNIVEAWANNMPTAVLTGKGIIPTFGRGILTIAPIAIGLQKLGNTIKSLYPTETEKWQKEQEVLLKKLIEELGGDADLQLKNMAELYYSIGWVDKPELTKITVESYTELLKDPKYKEMSDDIKKERLKTLSNEKTKILFDQKFNETVEQVKAQKSNMLKIQNIMKLLNKTKEFNALLVEKLDYTDLVWEKSYLDFTTPWNFTASSNTKKGQIVFDNPESENGTYKIMIDGKEVWPNSTSTDPNNKK
jgi:hypothetical protein